jgi:hypothetical protein
MELGPVMDRAYERDETGQLVMDKGHSQEQMAKDGRNARQEIAAIAGIARDPRHPTAGRGRRRDRSESQTAHSSFRAA